MEQRFLIALSGKQFSGKDSIFNAINYIDQRAKRFALADSLKIEFANNFEERYGGVNFADDKERVEWANAVKKTEKGRAELIRTGREAFEKNPHYWVDIVCGQIIASDCNIAVCTDMRFEHEYKRFKQFCSFNQIAFIPIRIEADRFIRQQRAKTIGAVLSNEQDKSETELDAGFFWDLIVKNNGSHKFDCIPIAAGIFNHITDPARSLKPKMTIDENGKPLVMS